jgi:hypothetical protein
VFESLICQGIPLVIWWPDNPSSLKLLAQAGQRPRLRGPRHRQRPHEIGKVVGKSVELKAHRVGGEGAARQTGPLDRVLAFLDVLLAGAALVIEGDDALGRARQVGDDETDARLQLARMPLDLGLAAS